MSAPETWWRDAFGAASGKSVAELWDRVWPALCASYYLGKRAEVGRFVRVWGKLLVYNYGGTIRIGARTRIRSTPARTELAAYPGATLEIGERVSVNYGCSLVATGHIRIGNNCRIGTHVSIFDNDFHEKGRPEARPAPRPVMIEDDVWIATRVIVLKGVTVGRGAVVGAGSVVTSDIPPYSVAVGNPARVRGAVPDSS